MSLDGDTDESTCSARCRRCRHRIWADRSVARMLGPVCARLAREEARALAVVA